MMKTLKRRRQKIFFALFTIILDKNETLSFKIKRGRPRTPENSKKNKKISKPKDLLRRTNAVWEKDNAKGQSSRGLLKKLK